MFMLYKTDSQDKENIIVWERRFVQSIGQTGCGGEMAAHAKIYGGLSLLRQRNTFATHGPLIHGAARFWQGFKATYGIGDIPGRIFSGVGEPPAGPLWRGKCGAYGA